MVLQLLCASCVTCVVLMLLVVLLLLLQLLLWLLLFPCCSRPSPFSRCSYKSSSKNSSKTAAKAAAKATAKAAAKTAATETHSSRPAVKPRELLLPVLLPQFFLVYFSRLKTGMSLLLGRCCWTLQVMCKVWASKLLEISRFACNLHSLSYQPAESRTRRMARDSQGRLALPVKGPLPWHPGAAL